MTQNSTPYSFGPEQFWQACCAPFTAQTAYWQTLQNIVQTRAKTAQTLMTNNTKAMQGMTQAGSMPNAAALFSAWWGQNAREIATMSADNQSAATHLWEQWKASFPQLDKSVWTQQYSAWQQCMQQAKSYQQWNASSLQQCFAAAQQAMTQAGTMAGTGYAGSSTTPSTSSKTAGSTSATSAGYSPGPTAPGTMPRGYAAAAHTTAQTTTKATAANNLPLLNPETVKAATQVVREATTALADNTIKVATKTATTTATVTQTAEKPFAQQGQISATTSPATTGSTGDSEDNVTPLSSRTRMAANQHANVAAAGARRSVVARRASKGRRVAR